MKGGISQLFDLPQTQPILDLGMGALFLLIQKRRDNSRLFRVNSISTGFKCRNKEQTPLEQDAYGQD
jgi:hypothetical protein